MASATSACTPTTLLLLLLLLFAFYSKYEYYYYYYYDVSLLSSLFILIQALWACISLDSVPHMQRSPCHALKVS